MSLIRINRNPPRWQLNVFGIGWLVFLGIVGMLIVRHGGPLPVVATVWGLAAVVAIVGWCVPPIMRVVYLVVSYAASPIGYVISFVVLLIVYYMVLSPVGWLMRLLGYDPMNRRFDADAETYWQTHEQNDRPDRYFRQF